MLRAREALGDGHGAERGREVGEENGVREHRQREDSLLRDDLDLDSIDAIDLAVKIQEITGARVDEAELRHVRTVGDVVDLITRMLPGHAG